MRPLFIGETPHDSATVGTRPGSCVSDAGVDVIVIEDNLADIQPHFTTRKKS